MQFLYSSLLEINPKALKASKTASSFLLFSLGTIFPAPISSLSPPHLSLTEQTLDLLISNPYDLLTHFLTPPIDSGYEFCRFLDSASNGLRKPQIRYIRVLNTFMDRCSSKHGIVDTKRNQTNRLAKKI